jgi:hypothetical protein
MSALPSIATIPRTCLDGSEVPIGDIDRSLAYENFPQARSVAHQINLLPIRIMPANTAQA